ncbi:MAG TPA: hypothetical protein VKT78_10180, partial [Fimbriimonadaceae bacterium]|nr:hypothetical protein [Fimbriimonadaceae bacterium]
MQRLRILALLIAIVAAVFALVSCGGSSHGSAGRQCVKGGAEVVFEAVPSRGQTLNHAQMQTARRIMVNRLHKLGVRSPNVALRRSDEIVIQLSGVRNPAKAAAIVGSTGQLQFFDFERDLVRPTVSYGNPTPYPTLYSLLAAADANTTMGTPEAYYLFDSRTKATEKNVVLAGPYPTRRALLAGYHGNRPPGTTILAVPAHTEVVSQHVTPTTPLTGSTQPVGRSPNDTYWYLFKYFPKSPNGPPELSGRDLENGSIQSGRDPNGVPQVILGFTSGGGRAFQLITKR